jgi:D-glycero-alpha-D-manno-heptose-7-phosphate kinase
MLARQAIGIEMDGLGQPVGKQDQYIAAYGGLLCQDFHCDDSSTMTPLHMRQSAIWELRDSLMLFFVGSTRVAADLLHDQKKQTESGNTEVIEGLHFIKKVGYEIKSALEAGCINHFGELMHEHWARKRVRSVGTSNNRIDELYEFARTRGGATGGKLVGAGGSGFLLFHTNDRRRLRNAMIETGVEEMDFNFDFDGSVVLLRNR